MSVSGIFYFQIMDVSKKDHADGLLGVGLESFNGGVKLPIRNLILRAGARGGGGAQSIGGHIH